MTKPAPTQMQILTMLMAGERIVSSSVIPYLESGSPARIRPARVRGLLAKKLIELLYPDRGPWTWGQRYVISELGKTKLAGRNDGIQD